LLSQELPNSTQFFTCLIHPEFVSIPSSRSEKNNRGIYLFSPVVKCRTCENE
jgi:hypothetical protein